MAAQTCVNMISGGKGNHGRFIDRNPRMCAAGVPTAQPDITLANELQQFLLVDEVNALIGDAIIPPPPPRPLAPVFYPIELDQRHSSSQSSCLRSLINPPPMTKFQTLVVDLKETVYASYWKKPLGRVPDSQPMFPNGYDVTGTTYGKKSPEEPSIKDVIYPLEPFKGYPPSKEPGVQTNRNYCHPYNPDLRYGKSMIVDQRGQEVKGALTDDYVVAGTSETIICNSIQADRLEAYQSYLGVSRSPYNNLSEVPEGHTFGIKTVADTVTLKQCLSRADLNPGRDFFLECLSHLNSVRISLSKKILPTFFRTFYLSLQFLDKEKTGWLPAKAALEFALTKHIRVDIKYLGPLLEAWHAFDGKNIKYKTFCDVLNFKLRVPDLPKIEDVPPECLDFRTTYSEMFKPGQDPGPYLTAGCPSGRYLDKDYPDIVKGQCSAHKTLLPMETDMYACIQPSILSLVHVTHRDMYAEREPHVVRRVFEAAGENFTDEKFNKIWEEAKKYHSQGLVCYETFRRALDKLNPISEHTYR